MSIPSADRTKESPVLTVTRGVGVLNLRQWRPRRVALLTLSLSACMLVPAVPAQAAVPPVSARTSKVVTADALPTVQINGVVWLRR